MMWWLRMWMRVKIGFGLSVAFGGRVVVVFVRLDGAGSRGVYLALSPFLVFVCMVVAGTSYFPLDVLSPVFVDGVVFCQPCLPNIRQEIVESRDVAGLWYNLSLQDR